MLNSDQQQSVTEGGQAIQAGGNVSITNTGLSFTEVRQVALDVFRSNFYQLASVARQTAEVRAEEVTESFLKKLHDENPDGFRKANDPSFQYALYTAQREYARTGDRDLGSLLVDLLVDRSKQEDRDILQIVLDESLNTAPKLTAGQLATLAVIFLFRYTLNQRIGNHQHLGAYFDQYCLPFVAQLTKNEACYQHLQFSSCGSISMGMITLEHVLEQNYRGLFLKGFDRDEVESLEGLGQLDERMLMPCLNDLSKVQVRFTNLDALKENIGSFGLEGERQKWEDLFLRNAMSEEEIRDKCIAIRPYMKELFEVWSGSSMKSFSLTSVGIAIGHANIKRLVGEFANLSIWIN